MKGVMVNYGFYLEANKHLQLFFFSSYCGRDIQYELTEEDLKQEKIVFKCIDCPDECVVEASAFLQRSLWR